MRPTIFLPRVLPRPSVGYCRFCHARFPEGTTEATVTRHLRDCAEEFMEAERLRTEPFRDLECRDPEYQAYAERAWRQGRLRPSDKPV